MKSISPQKLKNIPFAMSKLKDFENYEDYAKRIRKTLYYGKLPSTDRPSFPVTGLLVEKFGTTSTSYSLEHLDLNEASSICYAACITPCSVIVALLYLDRLRAQNPEYLTSTSPSQVFVIALMVASKYLYDDGEEEEVFNSEWATSAGMMLADLNEAEKNFLKAIDWNLFVEVQSFMDGLTEMESIIAKKQGNFRGFFVYSDLVAIFNAVPSFWSSFLKLVGSALVICIASYTATVFVVVTGTLATRDCTIQIADRLNNILYPPITSYVQPRMANCSYDEALDNYEALIRNSTVLFTEEGEDLLNSRDVLGEEGLLASGDVLVEEEEESCTGTNSISIKFNALQTLTTALLLASSKFIKDSPEDNITSDNVFDTTSVLSFDVGSEWANESLPSMYTHSNATSTNSLSKSKKPRNWRKPKIAISNNTSHSERYFNCDISNSLERSHDKHESESSVLDANNDRVYLDYSRVVFESVEDFLFSRLSNGNPKSSCINTNFEPAINFSTYDLLSLDFPINSDHNYYSENSRLSSPTNYFYSWIWKPLLPTASPRKTPRYEVDWTMKNLVMIT